MAGRSVDDLMHRCRRSAGRSWTTARRVYLAHLVVHPGQLISRIICSNGELILGLLIFSSVDPLLRMSEGD